jgi:hypothetical protein
MVVRLMTIPVTASPESAFRPRPPRWTWITKNATVAVFAVQSQLLAPACFQLVSAAVYCSKVMTVPSDTGTSKAASTNSRTERLLKWNRPLR